MAVFRKRSNLLLTIVLVAVFVAIAFGMFSLFKRVDKLEPTKTVSSSAYTRGLLDDTTGRLPRDSEDIDYSGIHMKDFINADGLTCEIAEKAKIRYEINFFDEDYHFISVSKKTTDYAGDENPEGAVFALIEIIPTAEPDGIVSSSEVSKYIWEVLETYAQLYFIYVIQSSLIISNYSVRTDNVLSDIGNFPMWDSDFFKRDSRFRESFSRHSHILDFDSLRLGRKVLEDNPNKDVFEFGVILITEIGKERGNVKELEGVIKKADTANQKNDLFNSWLKMIRHSGTVDNFPFVRVITDEQRPASWGLDARELCEIVSIKESGETRLTMPFFSLVELLYGFVFDKFTDLYYRYRYSRGDNTLFMYLLKKITSKVQRYYSGIYNRFGYCGLTVQVESGTQDGEIYEHIFYISFMKTYSDRFATDCFSGFYDVKALRSMLGLDDIPEYETEKASLKELKAQNSYFVSDLIRGFIEEDKINSRRT